MAVRYPDFICIGAQKSGTTWLGHMLTQHPAVWLPLIREIHYFDALHIDEASAKHPEKDRLREWSMGMAFAAIRWNLQSKLPASDKLERIHLASLIALRDLTDEWYGSIFAGAARNLLCGDITPGYALLPDEGIEHIIRLRPGVKIIFIMRDPIDRGWSDLRLQQKIAGAADVDAVLEYVATERFFARSDYMTTIERYRKYIPESNFELLFFDHIEQQPQDFLTTVHAFLGLDASQARIKNFDEPVHEGAPATMTAVHYDLMKQRLAPAYERLRALNNPIVEEWYRKHYK